MLTHKSQVGFKKSSHVGHVFWVKVKYVPVCSDSWHCRSMEIWNWWVQVYIIRALNSGASLRHTNAAFALYCHLLALSQFYSLVAKHQRRSTSSFRHQDCSVKRHSNTWSHIIWLYCSDCVIFLMDTINWVAQQHQHNMVDRHLCYHCKNDNVMCRAAREVSIFTENSSLLVSTVTMSVVFTHWRLLSKVSILGHLK